MPKLAVGITFFENQKKRIQLIGGARLAEITQEEIKVGMGTK
jgi:hypothetical protein